MDAEKIMSLEVITVPPELSLEAAHRINAGPRAASFCRWSRGRQLAGILSDREPAPGPSAASQGAFVYRAHHGGRGDVAGAGPSAGAQRLDLRSWRRTMVDAKIDALPIITSKDVLIRTVTSTDLMRVLSQLPKEPQPTLAFQIRRAADLQGSRLRTVPSGGARHGHVKTAAQPGRAGD